MKGFIEENVIQFKFQCYDANSRDNITNLTHNFW